MLRLYYIPMACSMTSHIALIEAGAEHEIHKIDWSSGDLDTPEFRRLNPNGFVPILLTDQGPLSENAAILMYIGMNYPDKNLLPITNAYKMAKVQSFNTFLSNSIHITYRHISRPTLFADGASAAEALRAKVPQMSHKYFSIIENQLSDGRTWIHGDDYTTSDPYLFVYSSYLQWGDRGDPGRFPLVKAHRERVLNRPAVQKAIEREGLGDPADYCRITGWKQEAIDK